MPPLCLHSPWVIIGSSSAFAQIIPANRLANWTPSVAAGVPGGIPNNRTNLIDVTKAPYNADKTGATDTTAAIQAAINAAVSNQVVYLPAGTYRVNGTIAINQTKSGITVRGAGPGTVIMSYSTYITFNIGSGADYQWAYPSSGNQVTAGLAKGSTTLDHGRYFGVCRGADGPDFHGERSQRSRDQRHGL